MNSLFDETLLNDLTDAQLAHLMDQPEVALDTETLGLDSQRDALCLVQICDPAGNLFILRSDDWKAAHHLHAFLRAPVRKVIHNALFDCSMLLTNTGVEAANPYCTKIASKLARTYHNSHSLATLVKELCRVELSKDAQVSDWSEALNDEQLRYAGRDVVYLLEIKDRLEAKLAHRRPLASGISFSELNRRCQAMIPALVHLRLNGWNVEGGAVSTIFGQ